MNGKSDTPLKRAWESLAEGFDVKFADFETGWLSAQTHYEAEMNDVRAEIQGWKNKWESAVTMAAIAQTQRDSIAELLTEVLNKVMQPGGVWFPDDYRSKLAHVMGKEAA